MTPASDRNETCPTCGSKDAPRVCCPGTHAPDDHDSTCEPCWDPWHAATPAPREEKPKRVTIAGPLHSDPRVMKALMDAPPPAAVSATGREAEREVLEAAVRLGLLACDDEDNGFVNTGTHRAADVRAFNRALVAYHHAALRRGGEGAAAPTPADPKNPAPAPASGAAKANPKEP